MRQWWVLETDMGQSYAVILDWRRAYGRINWKVQLWGDAAEGGWANGTRFIRAEDPPLTSDLILRATSKPQKQQRKRKKRARRKISMTQHLEEVKERDSEDPYVQQLAEDKMHDIEEGQENPSGRRVRRGVQ